MMSTPVTTIAQREGGNPDWTSLFPAPVAPAKDHSPARHWAQDYRWVLYLRISDDKDKAGGIEAQHIDGMAWLGERGVPRDEVLVMSENDTSAWKKRSVTIYDEQHRPYKDKRAVRPKWSEMLHQLRTNQRNAVLIAHQDRLVRDSRDLQDAIELADRGVRFQSLHDDVDLSTQEGRRRAQMMVWHAEMSSEDTSRRVKGKHRHSAQAGRHVGGPRPFGWADDRISLHPVESVHLRRWLDMLMGGASWSQIIDDAESHGVRGTKGGQLRKQSVRLILLSPRNCGFRVLHDDYVRDASGAPLVGEWETVCTPHEYARIIRERGERVRATPQDGTPREARHLLTGFVRCGRCGARLRRVPRRVLRRDGTEAIRDSYTCPSRIDGGCMGVARNAVKVEDLVLDLVRCYVQGGIDSSSVSRPSEEIGAQVGRALKYSLEEWARLGLHEQRQLLTDVLHEVVIWPSKTSGAVFDKDAIQLKWA